MSFDSDYQKLRKKRMQEKRASSRESGMLYRSNDIAPVSGNNARMTYAEEEEVAPVKEKGSWFNKGAFEDGYQFGDVLKTIGGTILDVRENLVGGLLEMGEGIVDASVATGGRLGGAVAKIFADDETDEQIDEWIDDFIAKDLYDGKEVAKKIIGAATPGSTFYDTDKHSVLGENTEGIVQSGGQLLGTAALQAIGVPWQLTMGVTSFGGEMEDALQSGATTGEAYFSSTVSAGAEILAGSLFKIPGISATGSGKLGSGIVGKLTKNISNTAVKNLINYGVNMAGEGAEEVLTSVFQRLGKALSYENEEKLTELAESEEARQNYWNNVWQYLWNDEALNEYLVSGIGGAALAGVAGAPSSIANTMKGVDTRTGYTNNEQAVIDKEYENRVAEHEKDGEKLTRKQKDKIYDTVKEDLAKGYISIDTIESVLGKGATYEAYQANAQSESKLKEQLQSLQEEYDALQNMKRGEMTGVEQKREAELAQQIEQLNQQIAETQEKGKGYKQAVSEGVYRVAKNDRLVESYNERARRGQAFQADVKQYDEKQAPIVQKAIDSGVLNNTRRSHELVDLIAKLSAEKGIDFDFTNNEKLKASGFAVEGATVNGYRTDAGITVNVQSAKYLNTVVGHEITHVLEGTDLYGELQKAIFAYAETKGEYQKRYDAAMELYKGKKGYEVDEKLDAKIKAEVTADLVGDYLFTDSGFLTNLSAKHRNVFQKIFDEIKYLLKIVKAGSKEARELEKVKKAFDDAFRADTKTDTKSDTQFSISKPDYEGMSDGDKANAEKVISNLNHYAMSAKYGISAYGTYTQERMEREIAYASSETAIDYAKSYITWVNPTDFVYATTTSEQFRNQLKEEAGDLDIEKLRAESQPIHLTVDFETGQIVGHEGRHRMLALQKTGVEKVAVIIDAWNDNRHHTKPIEFMSLKGQYFGDYRSGVDFFLHNMLPLSKRYADVAKDLFANTPKRGVQYSLSDSDGKQLTAEQQEYFKDSKMRDENGNLQVMYHGSRDAGFHIFDGKFSDDDTSFFFVDRNDVAASYSGTTETYEAQSIRTADDMNKFIESIGAEGYEVVEKDGKFTLLYEGDRVADSDTAKGIYEEFCWYEGVGEGDANYKVYLNLTNPLVIDAKGRPWNKIDAEFSQEVYDKYNSLTAEEKAALVDLAEWEDFRLFNSEIQEAQGNELASAYAKMGEDCNIYDLFSVAADNFSEDAMRENARKYLNTREYAQRAKAEGYDGVIFRNIVDNGGYSNGSEGASTVAVAFNSNQIKSVANGNPTGDKDIRFSLSSPVEETPDLIAAHNLTANNLLKALELGGLAMPSIAITRADSVHNSYGEISLIIRKDAIDPQANRENKIYSGDAWTPVYPTIEFKPNEEVTSRISEKYYELARKFGYDDVRPLYRYVNDTEDALKRDKGEQGMLEALYDDTSMMQVYLLDKGLGKVETVQDEIRTELSDIEVAEREFFIKELGGDVVDGVMFNGEGNLATHRKQYWENHGEQIKETYKKLLTEEYGFTEEEVQNVFQNMKTFDFLKLVRDAYLYRKNGRVTVKTEPNRAATEIAIREKAADGYKEWVDALFKGIEEKTGIRNNRDYFTPSGNRRSWDALHWDNTLDNVVRVMREQGNGENTFFAGHGIWGAAANEYGSVEEVKADSDRLKRLSEEEYEKARGEIGERLHAVADRIKSKSESNPFIAIDNAIACIVDSVRNARTAKGILNELKQYTQLTVTEADAKEIVSIVADIAKMPTEYFEAKPRRAVGFDEVGVFVIPRNADVKLKQELLNRGYAIAEYDADVEGDRQRVVNQFEEYAFSLSAEGEAPIKHGDLHISGEDVAYAPVDEAADEGVAPVNMDGISPLTEEAVPVGVNQTEIDRLTEEITAMESRMVEAYQTGDESVFLPLMKQYEEMFNRRAALEAQETDAAEMQTERVDTLDDADMPPEIEHYYGEREPIKIGKTPLRNITKDVGSIVGLNGNDRALMENVVQAYAQGEITDADLAEVIRDNFSYAQPLEIDENLTAAQRHIKGAKLYIDKQYKSDFNGRKKEGLHGWRLDHFGHFTVSTNEASNYMGVDTFYGELNEMFPDLFPSDISNVAEQLERIGEVMNIVQETETYVPYDEGAINEVVKAIQNGVVRYIESDIQRGLAAQQNSFYTDIGVYEDIAPVFEHSSGQLSTDREVTTKKFYDQHPNEVPRKVATVRTTESNTRKQKGRSFYQWAKTHLVSKGNVFENLSLKTGNRALQEKFHSTKLAESKAQHYMEKHLKRIITEVEKTGKLETFQDYAYHLHNIDRMTLAERFEGVENKAVYDDSVTADVSRDVVRQIEADNPEFKGFERALVTYMADLRQMLVDGGVISQELSDRLGEMYPHYVPIRRVDKSAVGVSVPLDTNKTGVNSPIKRATGGNSDIEPLFATIAMRTQQTFRAIARNEFGLELRDTLNSVVASEDATIEDAWEQLDETIDTEDKLLKKGTNGQNPTFTVFDNGKRVTFDITDDMYDALAPTSEVLRKKNAVLNAGSEAFRAILTEYNLVFAAKNAIKDAQDILINSQHATRTYIEMPEAIAQIVINGKWAKEFAENGGDMMSYFNSDTKTFGSKKNALQIAGKVLGIPFKPISMLNNAIERAPRLAEYIASRKMGKSPEAAMLDAARVTTDFSDYGDISKFLNNNGFTFLTASISGANQQIRNIKEAKANGLKGILCLAGKWALAGLPVLLLNHVVWGDDDEFDELSDYVKDSYYIVGKTEDGTFVRIPKGRAMAVIQNAFEQMKNLVTGDDEVDIKRFGELLMSNLAPNNPLENNILAPIKQVYENKTWYGEDLVPSRLQDLPAAEQYDESTDSISKWLGEKLDYSPYKINYLLNQYSGGVGDIFLPMLTPEAESGDESLKGSLIAPWKDAFTADAVFDSGIVSDFYTKKDELTMNANSLYATDEDILKSKYLNSVNADMADLYQKKREIQNSDLSDAEKYEAVREVQDQINALARESLDTYGNVLIDNGYAEVGDRKYRLNKDGVWTKLTDEQVEKQDEVTNGLDNTPSEYWGNKEEYDFAYEYPERYQVARAMGGYAAYKKYASELYDIKADKDSDGKTITGSRKSKVIDYLDELDADYGEKLIIFKSEYNADDTYNYEIIDYLNSRDDITYEEMVAILKELGFVVNPNGTISW